MFLFPLSRMRFPVKYATFYWHIEQKSTFLTSIGRDLTFHASVKLTQVLSTREA